MNLSPAFDKFPVLLTENLIFRELKPSDLENIFRLYSAYEQNNIEVNKWLRVQYPTIRIAAKKRGAMIFWDDETGVRSHDQRGRSFSPKGITPVVKKQENILESI